MGAIKDLPAQAKLKVQRARSRHGFFDVALQTFKRHSEDDGGFYAAALTYYTFFSIFPLLLFATAALGYLTFLSADFRSDVLTEGVNAFPLLNQILERNVLKTIQDNRLSIAVLATLLTLYSGTGAVVAFQHALNKIYRVETEGSFLGKRLAALKFLASLGLIALASVALGVIDILFPGFLAALVARVGGLLVSVSLFAMAYKFLPHRARSSWAEILPGAIVAGVVFEVLKKVGSVYLRAGAASRTETFGVFATAATLLVAAYLICQVALLAAQLNAVLAERRQSRQFSLADQYKEEQ